MLPGKNGELYMSHTEAKVAAHLLDENGVGEYFMEANRPLNTRKVPTHELIGNMALDNLANRQGKLDKEEYVIEDPIKAKLLLLAIESVATNPDYLTAKILPLRFTREGYMQRGIEEYRQALAEQALSLDS